MERDINISAPFTTVEHEEYLDSLEMFGIKLGLDNIRTVLELLENPHIAYPTIHVAGTNGKGSVSAMLAHALVKTGLRTGLYTSPHIHELNERIQVNEIPITDNHFSERVQEFKQAAEQMEQDDMHPTYFECLTAVAFKHFHQEKVDIAVVEVGLGGKLDATNVLDPILSIITNIDLEHTDILGNTIEKIAAEKAGIIKEANVVTGASGMALEVISEAAERKKAHLHSLDSDFSFKILKRSHGWQELLVNTSTGREYKFELALLGDHQAMNAAIAVQSLELLSYRFDLDMKELLASLRSVSWPGRFQRVMDDPLVVLDSAHNPAGARVLANTLKSYPLPDNKSLIIGVLADKDRKGMYEELFPLFGRIIVTRPDSDRALSLREMEKEITGLDYDVVMAENLEKALETVSRELKMGEMLVIAGSQYLLGELDAPMLSILRRS